RCTDGASGRDLNVGISWRWAWIEFESSSREPSSRLPEGSSPWHNAPLAANKTKEMTRRVVRFTIAGPSTRPTTLGSAAGFIWWDSPLPENSVSHLAANQA